MKKFFSLIIAFIFIFIGFHNSMMSFAMDKNMQNMQNNDCCLSSDDSWCLELCCWLDSEVKNLNTYSNNILNKKIFKMWKNFFPKKENFIFKNKKFSKNISPPNFDRNIKYYWYSDLVRIIKSNT